MSELDEGGNGKKRRAEGGVDQRIERILRWG